LEPAQKPRFRAASARTASRETKFPSSTPSCIATTPATRPGRPGADVSIAASTPPPPATRRKKRDSPADW